MLYKFRTSEKGFTLIELLIVVAIIGILAAIAIPQFSAYRQRGYNAAANSDLRNTKTTQEALFADRQSYGVSELGATLATLVTVGDGPGLVLLGPLGPVTATLPGGALGTYIDTNADSVRDITVGMGLGTSSNVNLVSGTSGTFGFYVVTAQHRLANRAFATTAGGPAICYAEDEVWTQTTNEPVPQATIPTAMNTTCAAQTSGGTPVTTWVAL